MGGAPPAVRGRPQAERLAGGRIADRRALPGDLAADGRRHPGRRGAADGRRPARAAGARAADAAPTRERALRALRLAARTDLARVLLAGLARAPVTDLPCQDVEQLGGERAS